MTLFQRPKPAMLFVLVVLGIIFLVLTSGLLVQAQSTAVAGPLFVPLSASAVADLPANPTDLPASRTQYVTLNMASFDGGQADAIALNLFDGETLTAVQTRTDQYNNGSTVWVGQLPDQPNSDISLSMINGQ
ncbi:MAG: hypothetical protein KDD89_04410, partial [Anaerolineales bacterium]|nr:hypothetical protein [Anaerolineales bacterium]